VRAVEGRPATGPRRPRSSDIIAAQRDVPRIVQVGAHAVKHVCVADLGIRVGEARRAAGPGAPKALGCANGHFGLGFSKPRKKAISTFWHLSRNPCRGGNGGAMSSRSVSWRSPSSQPLVASTPYARAMVSFAKTCSL